MIYNDAYSAFAGGRHPELLGSKVREGWPEVADFNDNVMKVGLGGGILSYRDQELTLFRHSRPEQVWMNLDYSPVLNEAGQPAGVIAIVVETTQRVIAERTLKDRENDLASVQRIAKNRRCHRWPRERVLWRRALACLSGDPRPEPGCCRYPRRLGQANSS